MQSNLIDVRSSVVRGVGDDLAAKFEQEIPQDYLDDLKQRRSDSDAAPIGNMLHVATVPVAKVEEWRRAGFDIYDPNVKASEIVARLQREAADYFVLTGRRV